MKKSSDRDHRYMALALRLAAKGRGSTSPNPMVGAVVVLGSRIVGQGFHPRAGEPHAEQIALRSAGKRAQGATLYVTLEPCCHTTKRTPPCVPALIASGLRRVVVAMEDPNPSVSGRGIRALRRAGIEATVGCLRDKAHRLNEVYSHWIKTGRPFLILKTAMTLDGKIATAGGESRWITGNAARRHVHRLRSRVDAIMVGVETVLHDDPRLTVRLAGREARLTNGRQPLRVVLDSRLRIPLTARVLAPLSGAGATSKALVATTAKAPRRRIEKLRAQGATVLVLPAHDGKVSLNACLRRLGQMGVSSVLLEGGSQVNASALRAGLVNHVALYVAPLLLGGQDAKGVIGGPSPKRLSDAVLLTNIRIRRLGDDLLIEGNPRKPQPAGS